MSIELIRTYSFKTTMAQEKLKLLSVLGKNESLEVEIYQENKNNDNENNNSQ